MGRICKILKKWEGAPDEHQPGEAMEYQGRLLVTDSEKASAFNRQYEPSAVSAVSTGSIDAARPATRLKFVRITFYLV